jgi:predicted ATPase
MLDTVPTQIEEACDRLAERQLFIRSLGFHEAANGAVAAHYEFRHALCRKALYGRLSNVHRSKLHRSLGEQLMGICTAGRRELASELALHFEEGRDYEHAIVYLMLAAENLTRRFAHRDSIRVLQRAFELVPMLPASARIELEIQIL